MDPTKSNRKESIFDRVKSIDVHLHRERGRVQYRTEARYEPTTVENDRSCRFSLRWNEKGIRRRSDREQLTDTSSPFSRRDRELRFLVPLTDRSPESRERIEVQVKCREKLV